MANYYTIVTNSGKNALISALANKSKINLSYMSVGSSLEPLSVEQKTLKEQKHKFNLSAVYAKEDDKNTLIVEGVITADIGGFTIHQIGVFDEFDTLFAIAQVPLTTKPLLSEGAAKDMTIRFYLAVDDANSINIEVDNSVVLATKNYVSNLINKKEDIGVANLLLKNEFEKHKTISLTNGELDLSLARYFKITLTSPLVVSLTNKPTDEVYVYFVELKNAGNFNITWQGAIKWNKNQSPAFLANKTDLIGFLQTKETLFGFRIGKEIL